ncbi:golgin subfamily A member 4-like isoform X2 [Mytilus californianus]|uniref:golgin subfamily A member 4-like isoform X2 n=1 Tax=Mytilus californianus TaxID=6549 RepID=UPI00224580EB|nr:golgin subfamily A member 4-like isoform X2 [Mytilus californianus]
MSNTSKLKKDKKVPAQRVATTRTKSAKKIQANQDTRNENPGDDNSFLFIGKSPEILEDQWLSKISDLVKKKKTISEDRKFSPSLQMIYDALLKELCTRCGDKFEPIFGNDKDIQLDTIESENRSEVNTIELEKKLSEMKSINETLMKKKQELERQLTDVKDEKRKLDDNNKKCQSEVQNKTTELNEIKEKLKKLEKKIKEGKENPVGKAKDQDETKVDNNLQNKITQLEEKLENMTKSYQKEKSDLNDKLQEEISKIRQQMDEKNKSHDEEISKRKSVEKENLELTKKHTSLEQEVQVLQSKLKLSENQSKEHLEKKEKEIKKLEEAHNVTKAEKASLQSLLNDINSQVRQEVDQHTKKTDSLSQNLMSKEHEILDLKRSKIELERSLSSLNKQIDEQCITIKRKKTSTKPPDQKLKDLQEENEKLRDRLSQVAGSKLTDGNPAIADLGDPNRPTQLGEKFSELYDNEWTDAMEELGNAGDEKSNITTLRNIVEKSYDFGKSKSEKYAKGLESALLEISNSIEVTPTISKYIKDHRKNTALLVVDSLFKSFLSSHTEFNVGGKDVKTFIKKTLSLCWLMTIQDPPVILNTELSGKFNTDLFRHYTKSGSNVDYVVWPVVFLHEGGPIICKGVAQGK